MNCRRVEPLLSSYLEEVLSEQVAGAIAAHLEECPACRRLQGVFTATATALREMEEPLPPAGLRHPAIRRWQAEREAAWGNWPRQSVAIRKPLALQRAAGHPSLGWIAAVLSLTLLGFAIAHREAGEPMPIAAKLGPPQRTTPRLAAALSPTPDHARSRLPRRAAAQPGTSYRHVGPTPLIAAGFPGEGLASGSSRSRSLLPRRDRGDLGYVNRDPVAAIRQWMALSHDEETRIEGEVRRKVPVRDDFVRIPFPRLVSTSDRHVAAAAECYQREAAIVDARLTREVTLALKATALMDVCARLKGDSGIDLRAGPSVVDEKVTVFCKKLPLREVMRQLSRPFGYTWLRSGKAGEYRYELVQDLKSQLLEEELRNRDRNEALLALDQEMQRYRKYQNLSPDAALAAARTASGAEKELLERYAGNGWGPIQMYFRLSPQQLALLRAGQSLKLSDVPGEGAQDPLPLALQGDQLSFFGRQAPQALPLDLSRGVLQCLRQRRVIRSDGKYQLSHVRVHPEGLPLTAIPEARALVVLEIQQSELGRYTFGGGSGLFFTERDSTPGAWYLHGAPALGVGMSPAVLDPRNGVVNAKLSRDPVLQRRTTLRPQASCWLAPEPAGGKGGQPAPQESSIPEGDPEPRVTTADVLEALHQATGRPIVADYYTRLYPPDELSVQNATLFDALNRLADRMRLRWNKNGDWLQFRSTSYFHDRTKEVPNRLLTRWANSRKQSARSGGTPALTLDELLEIAQLTDAQLDASGMAEGARAQYGLAEWVLPRAKHLRDQLRFLSEFTPDQRRQAQTPDGLLFSRMTLAQQQGYLLRAFYDGQNPHLDDLGNAILNVDYRLSGWFRWSPPGQWLGHRPPRVRERTKEVALQAARRIDPGVDEAQIVPTRLDLVFFYMANRQDDPCVVSAGAKGWFSER